MNDNIDFIITWVDGNDKKWMSEKNLYSGDEGDSRTKRYRDWDNLRYWFRGIEKNASWVNSVFFVTYGHYPDWLNLNHPKLKIINHKDYIPEKFLPTFSSRTIDMNFHRIKELSEKFVYFNDDMFLVEKTEPTDFFVHGLPCDVAILKPSGIECHSGVEIEKPSEVYATPIFDTLILNKYFNKKKVIRENFKKWFSIKYGKELIKNILLIPWNYFPGIQEYHVCYSYLKSTYEELWSLEKDAFEEVCLHKFRNNTDYNHFVFSFWQLGKGNFYPRSPKFGKLGYLGQDERINNITLDAITSGKYKVVCVNDNASEENYERLKIALINRLDILFPEKSSFERY